MSGYDVREHSETVYLEQGLEFILGNEKVGKMDWWGYVEWNNEKHAKDHKDIEELVSKYGRNYAYIKHLPDNKFKLVSKEEYDRAIIPVGEHTHFSKKVLQEFSDRLTKNGISNWVVGTIDNVKRPKRVHISDDVEYIEITKN